nr:MAG TPA: hypothetical protein [Caudoviricetes sp.]
MGVKQAKPDILTPQEPPTPGGFPFAPPPDHAPKGRFSFAPIQATLSRSGGVLSCTAVPILPRPQTPCSVHYLPFFWVFFCTLFCSLCTGRNRTPVLSLRFLEDFRRAFREKHIRLPPDSAPVRACHSRGIVAR